MGSRTHVQPSGQQIGQLGARSLSGVLAIQAQANADNRPAIYIKNLGGGVHLVKNQCNDTPYKVSAVSPLLTFSAGQVVTLGSHRGMPGEVILGVASGTLGSDTVNVDITVLGAPFYTPPVAACPAPIRGKTYLALGSAGSLSGTAYASIYVDGSPRSRLPDIAWTVPPFLPTAQRVSTLGDVVIAHGDGDGFSIVNILTWDVAGGSLAVLELTSVPEGTLGGPVWAGPLDGFGCYGTTATVFSDRHLELQLYRFPVGVTDSKPLSSFALGPLLVDAGPWSDAVESGLGPTGTPYRLGIVPTGPDLQLVAQRYDLGRNVLIDFALGSRSWRIDPTRVAPGSAIGSLGRDGRPLSNTRGLVQWGSFQLAVVPSYPASPSFDLLPADWPNGLDHFSVSPDLSQLALYPFATVDDAHLLLRMPAVRLSIPTGCPVPAIPIDPAPWGLTWLAANPSGKPDVMLARD